MVKKTCHLLMNEMNESHVNMLQSMMDYNLQDMNEIHLIEVESMMFPPWFRGRLARADLLISPPPSH